MILNVFLVVSWICSIACKRNYLSSSLVFAAEKIAITGKKLMKKVSSMIRYVIFEKEQRKSGVIHGGSDGKGCEELDVSVDNQYSEYLCFLARNSSQERAWLDNNIYSVREVINTVRT